MSASASLLPVSVAVLCEGMESRRLRHSHQPGKGLLSRLSLRCRSSGKAV